MSMGSRILEARTKKGLTQEALAKLIGVSKGAIGNYETGVSFPKVDVLFRLFKILDVDANYLYQDYAVFPGHSNLSDAELSLVNDYRNVDDHGRRITRLLLNEELRRVQLTKQSPETYIDMLVYNFPAAAGVPMFAEDDSYERITFPSSQIPKGADFGIRISGNSMEPTIPAGTIVFVRKVAELRNGEIGIFMLDDEAACKRFSINNQGITLLSDNPAYSDIVVKDYQRFAITGKVLGYK